LTASRGTAAGELELGTGVGLLPAQPLIVHALRAQRTRLFDTLRGASDDDWRAPSRCSDWNVQEVVLHVCGAANAFRTVLTGERAQVEENFDPRTSPNRFVDQHSDETPVDTLHRFEQNSDALFTVVETMVADGRADRLPAVWGTPVDWRLLATHAFWDGWLHERDVVLPLGRTQATGDDEARLAVAYGLLVTGVMAAFMELPVDTELLLDGVGGGTFTLEVDGGDAVVRAVPTRPAGAPSHGDAVVVADALSGRGPEIGEVLDVEPDLVATLSHLRAFLLTPAG
jgi:uncharacterized protein (TIGR03083 family)